MRAMTEAGNKNATSRDEREKGGRRRAHKREKVAKRRERNEASTRRKIEDAGHSHRGERKGERERERHTHVHTHTRTHTQTNKHAPYRALPQRLYVLPVLALGCLEPGPIPLLVACAHSTAR